ncbi:MAG: 4Fe-4S binding protein [Clostridia bacterium]|jgi:ferredoxin-type protein NapH|nr:4Fe-4S binding protein [Clostridia bacterium]
MKKVLQIVLQVLFLALFVALFVMGRIQLWMGIFAAGVILSIFVGRLYCGWACPINTLMRAVSWIKRKLKIKSFKTPKFLKKAWVRYLFLGLFVAMFVFVMVTGKQLPVLPGLLAIGVALTLFFPEELWHRYLCPYGTIFSLVSAKSLVNVNIDEETCTNCGICKRVCPAVAVNDEGAKHKIEKKSCLICMDCIRGCKVNAIEYTGNGPK